MSFGINLKINNRSLQDTLNKLKRQGTELAKEIDMELGAAAEEMATLAKQKAPEFVSSKIYVRKESFLRWSINSDYKYSAYIEFGTGKKYQEYRGKLSTEWQQIAQEFYVNGLGRNKEYPFLYPSVNQVKPKLFRKINNLIRPNK